MRFYFLLAFLFFADSLCAQDSVSISSFSYETLCFQTNPFSRDSVRVDVYTAVPYSILKFVNAGDKYVADYSIDIRITGTNDDSASSSNISQKSVLLPQAEWEKLHELDITRADASQHTFVLHQGREYDIFISIHDLSSRRQFTQRGHFKTQVFLPGAPSMSDPLLYRSKFASRIVPQIGWDISELRTGEAGLFYELYDAEQSVPLWHVERLRDADENGDEISRLVAVIVPTGEKRMPLFEPFDAGDVWTGKYILESYLFSKPEDTLLTSPQQLHAKSLATSERNLEVSVKRGIPLTGTDIDESIEQLYYIAVGGAYDSLAHAETKAEKRRGIIDFWGKMNPYPSDPYNRPMQTFYRRVAYANRNFGGSTIGWRTDRGRIYIQLGEPSLAEKHPYEANQKPYEMWEYHDMNLRFYFVDQFIVGDYRLVGPYPPNGTFNWQRESN
jgi:GWxTD domain-containing protein